MPAEPVVLGICVGGQARRMGGVQKALLPVPPTDEPVIARTLRIAREGGYQPVLLGAADLGAHALGVRQLPDAVPGLGPLSALSSLLTYAAPCPAICLACDMPFITAPLLRRLASEQPHARVLAPRDAGSGKWQPLFARYASSQVLPVLISALAAGERSFQGLFAQLAVTELQLDAREQAQLRDWDTPEDMQDGA